jgi:predicted DNA-binding ribbon-helix-helix protein
VKRSIVLAGHKTSVSLEDAFWEGLKKIAKEEQKTLSDLVGSIDTNRKHGNLSSALRLFVLSHYQAQAPDDSDQPPLFSDEQIDTIAQALADLRVDMRTEFQSMIDDAVGPLTEAVAVLQGQVSVLMNLIGSLVNNNTVKEASETKTKTVRRVRQIESKPR